MPNNSLSITLKDNYSAALSNIRNANKAFGQDLSGLQNKLNAINNNKASLKLEIEDAKRKLAEMKKGFTDLTDEVKRAEIRTAEADYEQARQNLKQLERAANDTRREMRELSDEANRADNRAGSGGIRGGSGGSNGGIADNQGFFKTLAKSGITQMIGQSASAWANAAIGSMFGDDTGNLIGGALSGAASGAAIGMAAGPVGGVVGGLVGAVTGLATASAQNFEKIDDYYKSVVQERFNEAFAVWDAAKENGSGVASNREQKKISFSTLLGSEAEAGSFIEDMTAFAARTPFTFDTIANMSRTLLTYGYDQDEILKRAEILGDTGSALGLSTEDTTYIGTYLGRMKTTNKTTMEYLNPLLERGIDVYEVLQGIPELAGKSTEEIQKMISKGLLPGQEVSKHIYAYLKETFGGASEKMSQTFQGLSSTLEDAQDARDNAMGEAYNEERKGGIQAEIDFLQSEQGQELKEGYAVMGEWQAEMENKKEELLRETYGKLFAEGSEYMKAKAAGDRETMTRLLTAAQAEAKEKWEDSDEFKLYRSMQENVLEDIQGITAGMPGKEAGYKKGYEYMQGFTEGILNGERIAQAKAEEAAGGNIVAGYAISQEEYSRLADTDTGIQWLGTTEDGLQAIVRYTGNNASTKEMLGTSGAYVWNGAHTGLKAVTGTGGKTQVNNTTTNNNTTTVKEIIVNVKEAITDATPIIQQLAKELSKHVNLTP